jgi:hypothetical protein
MGMNPSRTIGESRASASQLSEYMACLFTATVYDAPDLFQDAGLTPQTTAWAPGTIEVPISWTGGGCRELLESVISIPVRDGRRGLPTATTSETTYYP